MKTIMKRAIAVALSCCSLVLLPGCWDYQAINTKSAVIGLGIDPAQDDPERIRVTIQFPIMSKTAGHQTQGSDSGETLFGNLSTESYSLAEAFSRLQTKMDRHIDVAELHAVVLSGQLSGEAMDSVIGQLIRLPKINRLAFILMTPKSAQKILEVQGTDSAPMQFVENAFRVRQEGYIIHRELWQYWRDTTQLGVAPVIPIVTTERKEDTGKPAMTLGGAEAYWNNQPLLALSREETLYVSFLLGRVQNMTFDIPIGQGVMSLTNVRGKSYVSCTNKGKHIVLVDHVRVFGTLGKTVDPSPKPLSPTKVTALGLEASKFLTQQLTSTLEKLQQKQTDVVGFGRIYLQMHPEEETRLKKQWGEMFQHAKLDIKVDITIRSKGMLI